MHQIDLLISEKQQELEDKVQALKTQLQCRERDLSALRVSLEQRDAEASTPLPFSPFYEGRINR